MPVDSALQCFNDALDLHENLLHAETQAIAAKDLQTIESIIDQKESSIKSIIEFKSLLEGKINIDFSKNDKVQYILELQKRNAVSFKKFYDERSRKEKGYQDNRRAEDRKVRSAYLNF